MTPGPWHLARMLEAMEQYPLNIGFLGKGNTVSQDAMLSQIRGGALGLKLHEDWGSTPAVIDASLTVADRTGIQVAIHTDTLNEAGFVGDTLAAIMRPRHPRLPHRGCGRRARAGHHDRGLGAARAAELHEPDAAVHGEHRRGTPRHADGVPSPQPGGPRGPGVRRIADPAVDDRRRGRPARPRGDLDHLLRRAGHGPGRRGHPADLADGARHEAAQGLPAGRRPGGQPPGTPLHRQVHDQPRARAGPGPRDRLGRGRQTRRPGAVGAGCSSASSRTS